MIGTNDLGLTKTNMNGIKSNGCAQNLKSDVLVYISVPGRVTQLYEYLILGLFVFQLNVYQRFF